MSVHPGCIVSVSVKGAGPTQGIVAEVHGTVPPKQGGGTLVQLEDGTRGIVMEVLSSAEDGNSDIAEQGAEPMEYLSELSCSGAVARADAAEQAASCCWCGECSHVRCSVRLVRRTPAAPPRAHACS